MPWLTPETLPETGDICRPLFIPNDPRIIWAVSGALLPLTYESSWEAFGAVTPAAIAGAMADMLQTYFTSPCPSGAGSMPIGAVFPYLSESPPDGSVALDGTIYLDTDYPDFWAVIDPVWKTDATHWQAPDMRDRFPVGAGSTYDPGDTGGENTHALTAAENGPHNHQLLIGISGTTGNKYPPPSQPTNLQWAYSSAISTSGSGDAHENRPPFLAFNWAVQVA